MAIVGGAPYFDLPPGDDLAWRNRRIIAERMHWPDGALEACETIERQYPAWYPNWRPANTIKGFEAPAGYYAVRRDRRRDERPAYGADPAALLAAIKAVVSRCPRCHTRYPVPPGSDLWPHEAPTGGRCDVHWSQHTAEVPPGRCADLT